MPEKRTRRRIRRIGLTGGIGSGKSTVAGLLRGHGYAVIDTDAVTHELLSDASGSVVARIAAAFGRQVVAPDGTIDRKAMAAVVFGDEERLGALEAVLHPAIGRVVEERITALPAHTHSVIVEVPLLFEAGWDRQVDVVVVVDCSVDLQIERFMGRSGATSDEARRRIESQLPRAQRLARADFVVTNDGPLEDLKAQVEQLVAKLRKTGEKHVR